MPAKIKVHEKSLMKAIVQDRYGSPDVLRSAEVEKPIPKDDQILLKIHAAAANPLDRYFMRGTPFFLRFMSGLFKPKKKILGVDVSGTVEAVGAKVTRFQLGDAVFGGGDLGSFAEYICLPEKALVKKPSHISFQEAAAAPIAAITALQGLRNYGRIQKGQQVLINGASGGVGSYALQLAKYFGAEVTAVCSTRNLEWVKALGADHVIDYTRKNFTSMGNTYDLILDTAAYHSISDYIRVLVPKGVFVLVGGDMKLLFKIMLRGPWISWFGSKRAVSFTAKINKEDLILIRELLDTGTIKSVIDRQFTMHEVPKAIRYLEEGHTQGKVVIKILE